MAQAEKAAQEEEQIPLEGPEDRELIVAFKGGDMEAFEVLVKRYDRKVFHHCLRLVGNEEESTDLTQEVFIKVFRSIANYEHTYAFYTWLYRITVNCCIDHIRKKKRRIQGVSLTRQYSDENGDQGREFEVPDVTQVPEAMLANKELKKELREAIESLSDKLKVIIVLKEFEGFSYEEIAEILNVSRGTVKSRLFRARERLKELLEGHVKNGTI